MFGPWVLNRYNVIDTRIRPVKMRQTYQQEMKYLFELCGCAHR